MNTPEYIWINGTIIKGEKAVIPVTAHSLHYGSAVFEGIRLYETEKGPALFRFEDHLNRLLFSAQTMGMTMPYTKEQIKDAAKELIKKNNIQNGYVRPIVFYGPKMGLAADGAEAQTSIIAIPWGAYLGGKKAIRVHVSSFIRPHPKSTVIGAKISGLYYNSVLASREAKENGADEALMLDHDNFVAEGPGENIFFIQGKRLITPKSDSILEGITRRTIISAAPDLDYKIEESRITLKEALRCDEAFFCGTAAEITPIEQIGKRYFTTDKSREIKEYYDTIVRGKASRYCHWLTYIE